MTEALARPALTAADRCDRCGAAAMVRAVLSNGGLRAGIDAVVARLDLPVRVDVPAERLPAEIEASAYFIVAEALTNVVKHSNAGRADVTASLEDAILRIEVRDNGVGGADSHGHGLVGIRDRVVDWLSSSLDLTRNQVKHVRATHKSIVKPKSRQDGAYAWILSKVQDCLASTYAGDAARRIDKRVVQANRWNPPPRRRRLSVDSQKQLVWIDDPGQEEGRA